MFNVNSVVYAVVSAALLTVFLLWRSAENRVSYYIDELVKQKAATLEHSEELKRKNVEIETFRLHIEESNKVIEELAKKTAELEAKKAIPPAVKYKKIEVFREVESDECKDIKAVLDGIRNTDLNSLRR